MNEVSELLRHSRVLDLGPLPAPRLAANATVRQALLFLARGMRGAIVIVDGLRPLGILTERDVLNRLPPTLFTSRDERRTTPVREIMSQPPETIGRGASLSDALETMDRRQHRHLVVVDRGGDLRGLLTTTDIVQFLTDQYPEETVNLPPKLRQEYRSSEGA